MHAERVAGDDRAVRWVVPGGRLPVGRARRAPGGLGQLLGDGTLTGALVEDAAVWLWLGEGQSWRDAGARVEAALRDALADPGGWEVDPDPGEVLARVTADLLAGSVGDFIRSHGGSVAAERRGEEVAVVLGGACEHCPAAEHTLRLRLLAELRRRCPDLVEADRGRGQIRVRLRGR